MLRASKAFWLFWHETGNDFSQHRRCRQRFINILCLQRWRKLTTGPSHGWDKSRACQKCLLALLECDKTEEKEMDWTGEIMVSITAAAEVTSGRLASHHNKCALHRWPTEKSCCSRRFCRLPLHIIFGKKFSTSQPWLAGAIVSRTLKRNWQMYMRTQHRLNSCEIGEKGRKSHKKH